MNKKKKKKLGLPIMVGTLAVLIIGYVGLTEYQAKKAEDESIQASIEEEENKVYLSQMNDVISIEYKNETVEMSFSKTDERWQITDMTDFPLDQSYPEELEVLLQSFIATRKLESPDALEAYGLDSPILTLQATDSEGNEFVISIGDKFDSEYYAYMNGDESVVYTIDETLITATSYGLYDMIILEELPVMTEANILKAEINLPDGVYLVEREVTVVEVESEESSSEEASEAESEETTAVQTEEVTTWYVSKDGGERRELTDTEKDELIYMIANAEIKKCVNYKANETELADYGLKEGVVTISVTYELEEDTETLTLHIGNLDVENAVYFVTINDSIAINEMEEELFSTLMDGSMGILN